MNSIGTFAKGDDYTGLRPAAVVAPLIAATLAHGARPWIVDGFDLGPTDAASRREMARLLGWQATHPEFFTGETLPLSEGGGSAALVLPDLPPYCVVKIPLR